MYCVYKHVNKVNGMIYFGVTKNIERRWQYSGKQYKSCHRFYKAILEFGWDGFYHIIIKDDLDKETAFNMEINLIKENKGNVYNISDGGDCGPTLYRERNPNYHKVRSKEHCERLSESLKGHFVSEKTKQKISDNNMMKRSLMCVESGETFDSITHAAEKYNTFVQNIWRAVSGKRKSWHGLHFVYTDNLKA